MGEQPNNKDAEIRVAVYEVTEFYCPRVPMEECDQRIPVEGKIVSVTWRDSDMQTYHEAFKNASDGAPLCPIHEEQMMPQLRGMTYSDEETPED